MEHRCSLCGSAALVIRAVWLAFDSVWQVSCGDCGAALVPEPGLEITVFPETAREQP